MLSLFRGKTKLTRQESKHKQGRLQHRKKQKPATLVSTLRADSWPACIHDSYCSYVHVWSILQTSANFLPKALAVSLLFLGV